LSTPSGRWFGRRCHRIPGETIHGYFRQWTKNEELVENIRAMIQVTMIRLMLHRLCRPARPQKR